MLKLLVIAILLVGSPSLAQKQIVFTSDIDNFWIAFDSVQTTTDREKQLDFLQTLYVDKGTAGLHAFMESRKYSPELWLKLINQYPKFWRSIRPNTLLLKSKLSAIEKSIERLRELYPALKPATIYFTIGGLMSGGTTSGDMVLVGSEIATADGKTDVSEFESNWLPSVFKEQKVDNIIAVNIHEYVHTQQKKNQAFILLSVALREGACDFITELVINAPLPNHYIIR